MLGTILAFASAAFFGMNAVSARRGVLTGTVLQGMSISLGIGLPFFIVVSVLLGSWEQVWEFSSKNYFLYVSHFASLFTNKIQLLTPKSGLLSLILEWSRPKSIFRTGARHPWHQF